MIARFSELVVTILNVTTSPLKTAQLAATTAQIRKGVFDLR